MAHNAQTICSTSIIVTPILGASYLRRYLSDGHNQQARTRQEANQSITDKVDFKKSLDAYQAEHGQFRILDVPDLQYLMVDGHGDPNTSATFTGAVEALYPVAYKLKFASKRTLGRDYVVMPLEGLWWAADMESFTTSRDKSRWHWTMMIMVPDWIDEEMYAATIEQFGARNRPARLDEVRLESLFEGLCVQTLHIGSSDDEAELLSRMHHEFIPAQGVRMVGTHHEIYLSDARKVPPEKRRTILRQPVSEVRPHVHPGSGAHWT